MTDSVEAHVAPRDISWPRGAGPVSVWGGARSKGSREGSRWAQHHLMWWAAVSLVPPMRCAAACLFALHLRSICNLDTILWPGPAHLRQSAHMHVPCRALRTSGRVRASRLCDSVVSSAMSPRSCPTVARAELGSGVDPDDDLRRFGDGGVDIYKVVPSPWREPYST